MCEHPFALMGIIVSLFSLYRLWKIISIIRRRSASVSWTLMTAQVCDREIAYTRDHDTGHEYYQPKIMYSYTVMGEEFKKTISLKHEPSRSSAENILANFGDHLEVYYNPEKPKEHISREEKVSFFDIFVILVFLSLGLLLLWISQFVIR